MRKKWNWFDYLNILLMLFVGVITVYPVLYVFAVSLSDSSYIIKGLVSFFPRGFNLDAYKFIMSDNRIPRAFGNSVLYTTVGVLFNVFFTAISAYPLSKKDFFGRKYFMVGIIITMFFSGGMIPNFIIVRKLNMIDTIWALVVPNAIWTFQLLILISFYKTIPDSLTEAALIDGASEYRILFEIMIPLSKPALASIALFYFMGHWNSYFLPMIYLNSPEKYPLQLVLRDMIIDDTAKSYTSIVQQQMTPEAMKNATIILTIIPVLLVYPFLQKYFVKGITLGSVKG